MNVIQSLIATSTIAIVSLSHLPIALSETVNSAPVIIGSSQRIAELPASFQPGLHRVIFPE
ncbi:hypothetical protein IFO70_29845 [Phormidium tenue FACHB-886]|nr:hypothetical protein [Phormidium tenue FACHB-886]